MIVKIIGGAPFAISIILTIFMAGLGLGSYIASRKIDRIKDASKLVRIYGILELVIGGYCLILPVLLRVFEPVFAIMYNRLFEQFMLYNFLTFLGCAVLLIVPVICMGATLPILCRFYVSRLSHLGDHIGRLYGLNTIGAAVGSLVCGFWLINYCGTTGTLVLAVAMNVLIGVVCVKVSYRIKSKVVKRSKHTVSHEQAEIKTDSENSQLLPVCALLVFAVSGFCSMGYEVIWTKLLGLIIGPTTYSFTIVLVTFITGLALGSMLFGWWADKSKNPMILLVCTQITAAVFALFLSQIFGNSQFFFAKLIYHMKDNFALLNFSKALILFGLMLLPTLCLGATFPLVGKIYTRSIAKVGRSVGFAYAINTIGAVLGSFCAGFVLIPLIGKENGLRLLVSLQSTTALTIAFIFLVKTKKYRLQWIPVGLVAIVAIAMCTRFPNWNRKSLSTGRYHRMEKLSGVLEETGWAKAFWKGAEILGALNQAELVYYGDGIGGFTTVTHVKNIFGYSNYTMSNSGKPDASSRGDLSTQLMLAHVPMMFHPNPKSVMVLGHASGITSGEVLNYPVDRLDTLEISDKVVQASHFFDEWNGKVLSDPRTDLIIQDGRAHLQLTNRKYDVVISEPSNPWMAGLATLFTYDFFEIVKDRLNRDGIFCQWIHSYQMDWETFATVGRTFAKVFDNSIIFRAGSGDYLLIGINGKEKLKLLNARKNLKYAKKSQNATILDARLFYRMIITEDLDGVFGQGDFNTDSRPKLEYAAPKTMYLTNNTIHTNLHAKRGFYRETQKIIGQLYDSLDLQIDFAEFAFSVNSFFPDMVELSKLDPQQRERFYKLAEQYSASHAVDFDMFPDEKLKARCRQIQIEVISNRFEKIKDKGIAYYALGNLYLEQRELRKSEAALRKSIEFKPDKAVRFHDLARALHLQGKLTEAINYYDKAIQLQPTYYKAIHYRQNAMKILKAN